MIVLNLTCDKLHRFEGWFASGDEFAAQHTRGMVSCPMCGSHTITKLPSGPHVKRSTARSAAEADAARQAAGDGAESRSTVLMMLARHLIASSEDVGERFPEEARRIHNDEAAARSIRGVATAAEKQALLDEGIMVFSLPVLPKGDVH